jgi:hypothetical protein
MTSCYDALSSSDFIASGVRIMLTDELERMCKEVVVSTTAFG